MKESFAVISDYLNHTKDAAYIFMSKLFDYCVKTYSSIKLINVFSDGASSQFKQRHLFSNFYEWEKEFSINLIWNFFATSHGKGAVDGIGGTIKRSVWRQVKANSLPPHNTKSYAEIAKDRNPNITIVLVTSDEVKQTSEEKVSSWSRVLSVLNTQKVPCVKPKCATSLEVSTISTDDSVTFVNILPNSKSETDESEYKDNNESHESLSIGIGDLVLICYDEDNFPGEITQVIGELDFEVNVMHRSGGVYWKWPLKEDKIFHRKENIVKKLNAPDVAGSRGQVHFQSL